MATGTGLDAQLGCKTETTVGTKNTPVTQFFPFNSAGLTAEPSYIENSGIQAGARIRGISQVGIARKTATGKIEIPAMYKGFGWWMKHILGSLANPVLDGTLPYKQIHTPAGLKGLSFTAQLGKPQAVDGVVKPLTYNGCKVTDWELSFADNAITTLSVSIDGWDEDTSTGLATASYPTANQAWTFANVNAFTTGGTVSFAGGEMSIATGTAVPSVATKFTLSGKSSLATDRYGLGNAGLKKEQLEEDFFEITGSFEGEYDETTWATPLRAGTTVPIQITSTGPLIEAAKPYLLDIIMPACKITKAPAEVSGPGIVSVSGEFQAYDPEVASQSAIQIKLRSTDSAAW
jgi:Phage tail tube protein